MTVLIKGPPPIQKVADLKVNGVVQMYALLWESAYKDVRMDKRKDLPKSERRDCGGTSEWSIKGIADKLSLGKATVLKAMRALLEHGFISIDGMMPTGQGKHKRIFRVTPPDELENRRHAIDVMGPRFLDSSKYMTSSLEFNDAAVDDCSDEQFNDFLEEGYDPSFCGLWEGDFTQNVKDRLSTFTQQQTDAGARRTRQGVASSVEAAGLRAL